MIVKTTDVTTLIFSVVLNSIETDCDQLWKI